MGVKWKDFLKRKAQDEDGFLAFNNIETMDDFTRRVAQLGLVASEDDRRSVEMRLKALKKLRDTAAKAIEGKKQAAKARGDEEMPKVVSDEFVKPQRKKRVSKKKPLTPSEDDSVE